MRQTKATGILYGLAVALILTSALIIESRIKAGAAMTALAGLNILAAQHFSRKEETKRWTTK